MSIFIQEMIRKWLRLTLSLVFKHSIHDIWWHKIPKNHYAFYIWQPETTFVLQFKHDLRTTHTPTENRNLESKSKHNHPKFHSPMLAHCSALFLATAHYFPPTPALKSWVNKSAENIIPSMLLLSTYPQNTENATSDAESAAEPAGIEPPEYLHRPVSFSMAFATTCIYNMLYGRWVLSTFGRGNKTYDLGR